jgi:putative ABC transport system ATP-binding protein
MEPIVSAKGLVKKYGTGAEARTVLDGVSLDIRAGEFVSIMGPSGSGKSTLLYALSGMDAIDGGSVSFRGEELSGMKESRLADARRRSMGFVFQQPTLLKVLSVADNVALPALREKSASAAAVRAKARSLMERVGIAELADRDVTRVSGGQLQRAGICRALMNDPVIVFGDEPTGALNSAAADGIMDILEEIHAGGTAVVLVTHDARVAARTGRVLFMRDGRIAGELALDGGDGATRREAVVARTRELGI